MAKVGGVFTGWKGKVGNVVFSMWKGIQVAKTKVTPENPQSPAQTTNRTLLSDFVAMFKIIVDGLVNNAWDPFTEPGKSGWGNLIGANQKEQAGSEIDYEKIIVSKGSLGPEAIVTATYDTATGAVVATWLDSGSVGTDPTDVAVLFIFDSKNTKWRHVFATREDETIGDTIPIGSDPEFIYCYLLFCTPNFAGHLIETISNSSPKVTVAPE